MTRSLVRMSLFTAGMLLPALTLAAGAERVHATWPPFITGPVLIFLTIAALLVYFSVRDKRRTTLIERFVEKGQEIPPSLLPQPPSPVREIRRGVWFTSLGIGWFLVLYLATSDARISAAWSVILLFLGAASFINAALLHQTAGSRDQR